MAEIFFGRRHHLPAGGHHQSDKAKGSSAPAFRELEVSIDGKPAGVVWPKPYIYTGGVNPLLWRPITGIQTMNIPTYKVDLSPFAGMLGGKHTIKMTVVNNADYWLVSGALLLNEDAGVTTSGSITTDTLSFPENAPLTNTPGYGSGNSMASQTANRDYTISGTVLTKKQSWTAKVHQTMQFSNDQTNTSANYFGLIHGNQMVTSDSTVSGHGMPTTDWHNKEMYTIDAADGYIQDTASSNYLLPTNVTQALQVEHQVMRNGKSMYDSHLYETIEGYAAIQTGSPSSSVALGSSTGYANYTDSLGQKYNRVITARGGKVVSDDVGAVYR